MVSTKIGKIDLKYFGIQKNEKLLDVGCGRGVYSIKFAKHCSVYGIDSSDKLLHDCKQNAYDASVDIPLVLADAENIPFKDKTFDKIAVIEILEHISNTSKTLKEIFRVLKDNGSLCISIPTYFTEQIFGRIHPEYFGYSGHVRIIKDKQFINELLEAGFSVYKIKRESFEWALYWLYHSIRKTKFDVTGTPEGGFHKSKDFFQKIMCLLTTLKIDRIGNAFFPKSFYFYCKKISSRGINNEK